MFGNPDRLTKTLNMIIKVPKRLEAGAPYPAAKHGPH